MNLSGLIPLVNSYPDTPRISTSNERRLETGNGVFYERTNLYSNDAFEYYVNLIFLFDSAIMNDNLKLLSVEQERLLAQYFLEADTITPPEDVALEDWIYDFDSLSTKVKQLDEFLGSYLGENDGQFTAIRNKQLYR